MPKKLTIVKSWRNQLLVSKPGRAKKILANALLALRSAPQWQGAIGYNEFANKTCLLLPPPWHRGEFAPQDWGSYEDSMATEWLQRESIEVGTEIARQAVETVARDNKFHPLRDYLEGLVWDGKPRVHEWLFMNFGTEYSDYIKEIGKKFLISAVARIMSPGCKADSILVLEGKQGIFKSQAAAIMAGEQYFVDDLGDLSNKDSALQLQGVWIVEIAEMASLQKKDAEIIKAFISRSTDKFRPPYGKRREEFPRQCVFIATTNEDSYLKDPTGARRFWPVKCRSINLQGLRADRDQLWAEALHLYKSGEKWWLDDPKIIEQVTQEQKARYQSDPWDVAIEGFVTGKDKVQIAEVLKHLGVHKSRCDQSHQNRAAKSLTNLGFERKRVGVGGKRPWFYVRVD